MCLDCFVFAFSPFMCLDRFYVLNLSLVFYIFHTVCDGMALGLMKQLQAHCFRLSDFCL